MRVRTICFMLVLFCAACSGSTGPVGDDRQDSNIRGEYCAEETTEVTRNGNDATVVLFRDELVIRREADSDGYIREIQYRSCLQTTCIVEGGAEAGDAWLIRICEG